MSTGPTSHVIPDIPKLRCLVLAENPEHHKTISEWLGVSKRVGSVTSVYDKNSLRMQLEETICHIAIEVVTDSKQHLISNTAASSDTRVLVVTESRKTGNRQHWYQQGASDIASLKKPDDVRHSISRLIDECVMQLSLRLMAASTERLKTELEALKRSQNHPLTEQETPPQSPVSDSQNVSSGLSTQTLSTLTGLDVGSISRSNMVADWLTAAPANQPVGEQPYLYDRDTGLPLRAELLRRLQHWLRVLKHEHLTAMLVEIDCKQDGKATLLHPTVEQSRITSALQMAASVLVQHSPSSSLIGRSSTNALMRIDRSSSSKTGREAVNELRHLLRFEAASHGNVAVRLHSISLPRLSSSQAKQVFTRLESRALAVS